MTQALLLARHFIIYWVNVSLAPVELTYDMVEAELLRRGVDLLRAPGHGDRGFRLMATTISSR